MTTIVAADARDTRYGAAWFAFLGAPAGWTIYELASYAITAHACYPMNHLLTAPSSGAAWTATLIITIVCLIVALAAFATAIRMWSALRPRVRAGAEAAGLDAERGAVMRYMAFIGISFGALFSALIVFGLISLVTIRGCG